MNERITIKRVFHPYTKWEDYTHGFYENCSGKEKESKLEKCIILFNSEQLTREYMFRVVNEWKYSCEHNLTNESLNQIAYIGQAACCLYASIPNTITMEAWSMLSQDVQERSNKIAKEAIKEWNKQNKLIQLCLNFD